MRRYALAALATVVVIAVALVLSSDDDDATDSSNGADRAAVTSTSTVAAATTPAPVTTVAPRGARGNGKAVTFAFAGDVNFPEVWDTEDGPPPNAPPLAQQVRDDPRHVLDPVTPVLSHADLAMVNLETAITDRGEPVAGKNYHFRSPAASFTALKAAGVDVVNMANNHALDYGPVGLAGHVRGDRRLGHAGHRDRSRRGRGVPAVPHHDQGAAHRHPQRDRLARARARRRVVGD